MIPYPAVVVHGIAEACVALAAGRKVALMSAPAAGIYGGAGWWRGLITAARARHPGVESLDILDCADAPGRALEALRIGQRHVILDPSTPAFDSVTGVAASVGAVLLTLRPAALDLGRPGADRQLAAWLAVENPPAT